MDSILLMLFKPGVCVMMQEGLEVDVKRLNRDVVWRNGVLTSSYAVPNEHANQYNEARIAFLRVLLILLSVTIYNSAEDYLSIINPFAAYLTN